MAEFSTIRLNVVLRELNISLDRAVEFLAQQNIEIEGRPTSKISKDVYQILLDEFETDKSKKDASHEISEVKRKEKESLRILQEKKEQERLDQLQKQQDIIKAKASISKPVTKGKIDLDATNPKPIPTSLKEVEERKGVEIDPNKDNPPKEDEFFYIVTDKCTECNGFHDEPQCAAVCPVDCCITDDDNIETQEELLDKKSWLHKE